MAKTVKIGKRKWYELDPKKHGIGGITPHMPKPRKQDRRAKRMDAYAVIFFPQYKLGFRATIDFLATHETISQTPEAARVKFADRIGGPGHPAQKWRDFHKAGHRVRRIRIIDLGPA